ncbi:MAG: hypothetical protein ACR2I5_03735 [Candidatus Limnocylindria bacterium]
MTATVRIQHTVVDFDTWKATFDRDPIGRQQVGVRRYRIIRGIDDPNAVEIDLDFDDVATAQRFRGAIEQVWQSSQAGAVLAGTPDVRIVEEAESHAY